MWSIKLAVDHDGCVVPLAISEGIPPGEIEIRGGDDGNRAVLEIRQRDPQGRFVISAHHRRDRAEEALYRAEDTAEAVVAAGGQAAVEVGMTGEMPA